VTQGYTQIKRINFEKIFAPVARLKAMQMTLVFGSFKYLKLFQTDVKSVFLNDYIDEEVHVEQPPSFVDSNHPNFIFKLEKALYGLK